MRNKGARADAAIAALAARQHGVVSSRQLISAGLTRSGIARRARAGRLHRIHQGVYAVGHAGLSPQGRWMAAVLACADREPDARPGTVLDAWGAALSHRSAAALWRLLPTLDHHPVDVSIPGDGGRRRRQGIQAHRRLSLPPGFVTRHQRIPVTTPARTIADLRDQVRQRRGPTSERELRRAIRQAGVLGLPIENTTGADHTRSELEALFLRLCRRYELPMPEVNVRIDSVLVDFLWRERRLIVETDGYRYHRGRQAFEDDRVRDLKLKALDYQVIRLTHRQVTEEPGRIAGVLTAALP